MGAKPIPQRKGENKMKKILCGLAAVAMSVSMVACGSDNSSDSSSASSTSDATETSVITGGTYIVQSSGEPSTLNPDTISDDYNYPIAQNIFSRLVKLTNDYTIIPDLADLPEVSDDALTYTFHLKEGVKWHDGELCTANDVVYTYQTCIDEQYAHANVFANVTDITATDDYTVVFTLSTPDGSFLSNLAWYGTFILPEHILKDQDWLTGDFTQNPVGTGPFKFEAWNKGTDVRIVRNDDYFGDTPYLDEVIYTIIPDSTTAYQAWLNNEVDELSSSLIPTSDLQSLIDDTDTYTTVSQVWPSPWYVTFNLQTGPFADPLVREAVAYGIDRDDVSTKATNGFKPAAQYYIPDIYTDAVNPDAAEPSYDPEKAMSLLEEAGYTKDADGYYFETTFKCMSGGFEDAVKVCADNLEKIGIKVTIDILDYNIWVEECMDNYDFEITMLAGFQGPDVLGAGRRWTTDGSINIPRYSNAEVDELYNNALQTSSTDERNEYMKEIQTHLAEDIPMICILTYADKEPIKNYIHGSPSISVAEGGSKEKVGFSELTYVWVDPIE